MPLCVGIDLGTTNTLCAVWPSGANRPHILPLRQPVEGLDRQGFGAFELLPSAVHIDGEGRVFVGHGAIAAGREGRGLTLTSTKKRMGTQWSRRHLGITWTAERAAAAILKAVHGPLLAFAQSVGEQEILPVITVPASFSSEQRAATLRAAAAAGFDPAEVRLLDEPTAALLHAVHTHRERLLDKPRKNLMMIDIGGGTLDVAILHAEHGTDGRLRLHLSGRSRYNELAGDDFDLALAGEILRRLEAGSDFRLESRSPESKEEWAARILAAAREAKEELCQRAWRLRPPLPPSGSSAAPVGPNTLPSPPPSAANDDPWAPVTIALPVRTSSGPFRTSLGFDDLKAALRDFFTWAPDPEERMRHGSFFRPLEEALRSARRILGDDSFGWSRIDDILLTGGSSRLPMVRLATQATLGRPAYCLTDPMRAVALGACVFAHGEVHRDPIALEQRLYDNLYLQLDDGRLRELVNMRETVPAYGRRCPDPLIVAKTDMRLELALFCGLSPTDPLMTSVARRRLTFPEPLPKGQPIQVDYDVRENRCLSLRFATEIDGRRLAARLDIESPESWIDERAVPPFTLPVNVPTDEPRTGSHTHGGSVRGLRPELETGNVPWRAR